MVGSLLLQLRNHLTFSFAPHDNRRRVEICEEWLALVEANAEDERDAERLFENIMDEVMHGSNRKGQGKILSVEEWWKRVLHHRMRAKGVKEGFGAKISRIWCSAGTRMPDTAFVHHVCSFRIHANARSFFFQNFCTQNSLCLKDLVSRIRS